MGETSYKIGNLYFEHLQQYEKAMRYFKEAIDIRIKHLGEDHIETLVRVFKINESLLLQV